MPLFMVAYESCMMAFFIHIKYTPSVIHPSKEKSNQLFIAYHSHIVFGAIISLFSKLNSQLDYDLWVLVRDWQRFAI